MQKVSLYEGAEKKSYYKYMDEEVWIPDAAVIKTLRQRGEDSRVLEFDDRCKIMDDNFIPEAPAVYYSKDGGLVVSSVVETPDITKEMAEWWFAWHPLDPLRYAIWDPQDHHGITISDEGRKKLLDSSIPMGQRIWDVPNHVKESFNGEKPADLTINFQNPLLFGYEREKLGTDNCLAIICMNDTLKKGPINVPVFATEILRKGPNGKNIWVSHWWIGCGFKDNQVYKKKVPFRKMVFQYSSGLVVHNKIEMTHLNKILPSVYAENKDNWTE